MSRRRNGTPVVAIALGAWLLVNLLQAAFTPLHGDEVYYWAYGWEPGWGYWNHAPAVGWLTWLGQLVLPYTELGARLFTVLLGTLTIFLLWRLTDRKDSRLFFLLVAGMLMVQIGGFFVSPDSPLGFSIALLLTAYATYLARPGWRTGLVLGVTAALVLYSKHHGLMLLGMLVLARPRSLREGGFWVAATTAVVLFLPGLWWLIEHDFITFRYHFEERDHHPWSWRWTGDFLLGQLALLGPFTGLLLLPLLFIHRPTDPFLRIMRTSAIGIFAFLVLLSFGTRVLGNWSAVAVPPLLLVACDALVARASWRLWALCLAVASCVVIMVARIWLVAGGPLPRQQRYDFRDWEEWAMKVREKADGRPVVFTNSYSTPARYAFETGIRDVYVLNNFFYHASQFDLWPLEERMQHRVFLLVASGTLTGCDSITGTFRARYRACVIPDFCSHQRLRIRYDGPPIRMRSGEEKEIPLVFENPYDLPVDLGGCRGHHFHPCYQIRRGGVFVDHENLWHQPLDGIAILREEPFSVRLRAPQEPGHYTLLFSLVSDQPFTHFGKHGEWLDLEVVP